MARHFVLSFDVYTTWKVFKILQSVLKCFKISLSVFKHFKMSSSVFLEILQSV